LLLSQFPEFGSLWRNRIVLLILVRHVGMRRIISLNAVDKWSAACILFQGVASGYASVEISR